MIHSNFTMEMLKVCLYRFCLLVCLFSAGYMTYLQFKYYLDNKDLASISYRKFVKGENYRDYPTFTICLMAPDGDIFKPSHNIFNSTNVTRKSYRDYLSGNLEEHSGRFSAIKFDDVAIDIGGGYLITSTGKLSQAAAGPLTMIPTFRDPSSLCISKQSFCEESKQLYDDIVLNSSMLYDGKLSVSFYVHQTGKVMRSLYGNSEMIFFLGPEKIVTNRIIDIVEVDVLRKRNKSKIPCQNTTDEDEYLMTQIIKSAKCIPTFLDRFAKRFGLNQTTRLCKSKKEYQEINNKIENIGRFWDEDDSMFMPHCTEMMTSITTKDETSKNKPDELRAQIYYHPDYYREIVNTKAYTSETLLGQVGGFVGMYHQL